MKIEWNKVTALSKAVALALFVALPFIGFWYGIQYGELAAYLRLENPSAATTTTGYYGNVAEWQVNRDDAAGFSIAYPIDFDAQAGYAAKPSSDWRAGANGAPGLTRFTLTIPRAFEPQSNFADAKLTVGDSGDARAVANCLAPDPTGGPAAPTSSVSLNGTPFTEFHSADVGAGNYYETTSYRTVHAGRCYAVEYTIHSTQIMNYPASYHLRPFDKAKAADLLDRIAGTFTFIAKP